MISYELCKQLKDAGFPQDRWKKECSWFWFEFYDEDGNEWNTNELNFDEENCTYIPNLSELIEACNKFDYPSSVGLGILRRDIGCNGHCEEYTAIESGFGDKLKSGFGFSPEEAVAKLWLELNKVTKNKT